MRELKFRAWGVYLEEYLGYDSENGICLTLENIQNIADLNLWIFEPYINLRDTNGREIAVGDIVNMHFFEQYLGLNGGAGEKDGEVVGVIGVDGIGTFIKANNKKYYLLNYLEDAEYCADAELNEELEVVGNIHENPELLEVK